MTEENTNQHWPQLSLLDVLRPPVGWDASDVVLSTYSLDLVVLVSAMLALTGRDNLEGGGSKVGLANAINHFRPDGAHRLAVLVQSGRIAVPRTTPAVLALLDRFVREVRRDQRQHSWHAKAALVRFEAETAEPGENAVEWRLWIGSRNLSRDMSWDTGLVLCGVTAEAGANIEGLTNMAAALLAETGWEEARKNRLLQELERVQWRMPTGVKVKGIHWLDRHQTWKPMLPQDPDEVVVITPFFNLNALAIVVEAAGKGASKSLLTTQMELDRQLAGRAHSLEDWAVTCLESSEQAAPQPADPESQRAEPESGTPEPWSSEDEELPMGLHAKIIAIRKGDRVRLLLGSANVTTRAWERNTELIVTLEGDSFLWKGIEALMAMANHAVITPSAESPKKSPCNWLADFRNALCNLKLSQSVRDGRLKVTADKQPDAMLTSPQEQEAWAELQAKLEIAPLAASDSDYTPWPLTQRLVEFPVLEGNLAGESEFLRIRLTCASADQDGTMVPKMLCWVQHVPLCPSPGQERDRRILAGYLNPEQFLSWISGLLAGYESDAEPWDKSPRQAGNGGDGATRCGNLPTVEALLKAWQRNSRSLQAVAETLERYFDAQALQARYRSNNDRRWIVALESFHRQLGEMQRVLKEGGM